VPPLSGSAHDQESLRSVRPYLSEMYDHGKPAWLRHRRRWWGVVGGAEASDTGTVPTRGRRLASAFASFSLPGAHASLLSHQSRLRRAGAHVSATCPRFYRHLFTASCLARQEQPGSTDRAIIIISDLPSPPFLVLQSTLAGSPTCQLSKFTLYFRQNYFGLYCAREKLN
jgi:hypothetical protein